MTLHTDGQADGRTHSRTDRQTGGWGVCVGGGGGGGGGGQGWGGRGVV